MEYLLKQIPEDFVVKEIGSIQPKPSGKYLYFKLRKRNRTTLGCVKELARQLNLPEKQIGFAGNKDKAAVTEQLISIPSIRKKSVGQVQLDQASLELLGSGEEPITLGSLEGNSFEIVARNLDSNSHLNSSLAKKITLLENYFDEQRFAAHNAAIGKHLLKKEFKAAVELIDDIKVKEHLTKHQNDFVGAMKRLSFRLLRMHLNAYQSYLWNETLSSYLKQKSKLFKTVPYSLGRFVFVDKEITGLEIPLVGFNEEIVKSCKDKEVKSIIINLLKKENISFADFIIKPIPELTLEGELRAAFIKIRDLKISQPEPDELHPGKEKVRLIFSLGKGSYATLVLKKLFS